MRAFVILGCALEMSPKSSARAAAKRQQLRCTIVFTAGHRHPTHASVLIPIRWCASRHQSHCRSPAVRGQLDECAAFRQCLLHQTRFVVFTASRSPITTRASLALVSTGAASSFACERIQALVIRSAAAKLAAGRCFQFCKAPMHFGVVDVLRTLCVGQIIFPSACSTRSPMKGSPCIALPKQLRACAPWRARLDMEQRKVSQGPLSARDRAAADAGCHPAGSRP